MIKNNKFQKIIKFIKIIIIRVILSKSNKNINNLYKKMS